MIHGQRLCGDITYTLNGEFLYLYHCHCAECRRFSGSSHATNTMIHATDLQISDSNNKLTVFALSEGARHFCSSCGAPIYSTADGGEIAALHCGSISNPPNKALEGNQWTSEKCPWVIIDESLTNFERGPK